MMPRIAMPAPLALEDTRMPPSTVSIRRTRLDTLNDGPRSLPVVNYAPAIAKAVEWLGDRDLLVTPTNATHTCEQMRSIIFSASALPTSTMVHSPIGGPCDKTDFERKQSHRRSGVRSTGFIYVQRENA
jgi:hypothetical protein